jgi:hypothetical protein
MDSRIWRARDLADRRTRLTRRISGHITQGCPWHDRRLEIPARSRDHPSRRSPIKLKRERNDINVVIIDYETAFDSEGNHSPGNEVDYSGGYICWPRRLLQSFSQESNHILPNLQMTFSHASWWSFTYCFHADLMNSMQGTFDPMAIKTPRRRYYKCGGILRVLKYGDGFINQQVLKTMSAC